MNENLPTHQLDNESGETCAQASEREMVKYFLGDLPPDKEQRLEELFFVNDQLFDRLQSIKEKLIDDYLHGKLSEEEQTLFEQNFLSSPPQRQQVEFARALIHNLPHCS